MLRHMEPKKVFILGTGKSGTTIVAYRILHALPEPRQIYSEYTAFGRDRGEDPALHQGFCAGESHVVSKNILYPEKFNNYQLLHSCSAPYTKKILIIRDPRDYFISEVLYRYYWRHKPKNLRSRYLFYKNYRRTIGILKKLEATPQSQPFFTLYADSIPTRDLFKKRFDAFADLFQHLGPDWFILKYENFVDNKVADLNEYLGFAISSATELAPSLSRIPRSRRHGNWRHWFNKEDISFFQPAVQKFMQAAGYDFNDWKLAEHPQIPTEEASGYVSRIYSDRRC